jgi:large subunit ribosomal protein L24
MNIKTGDTVVVIAGGDQYTVDKKGIKTRKTGRVLKVLAKENKVIVEGVNKVKKHQRPKTAQDKGGIVEVEAPIDASNVALLDPKTGLPTRVGYRMENGVKVRYAKKSGAILDKVEKTKTTKAAKATEAEVKPAKATKKSTKSKEEGASKE